MLFTLTLLDLAILIMRNNDIRYVFADNVPFGFVLVLVLVLPLPPLFARLFTLLNEVGVERLDPFKVSTTCGFSSFEVLTQTFSHRLIVLLPLRSLFAPCQGGLLLLVHLDYTLATFVSSYLRALYNVSGLR